MINKTIFNESNTIKNNIVIFALLIAMRVFGFILFISILLYSEFGLKTTVSLDEVELVEQSSEEPSEKGLKKSLKYLKYFDDSGAGLAEMFCIDQPSKSMFTFEGFLLLQLVFEITIPPPEFH